MKLLNDRGDTTIADGVTALADSEAQALLHSDGVDELARDGDVVAGHSHLDLVAILVGELGDVTSHVSGAEVELGTIAGEERGVTATLLLGENVNLTGELGVRRNAAGLAENLATLDVLALDATEQDAHVVASLCRSPASCGTSRCR